MNNLLRTLTSSQVKSSLADTDLKLLLSTVKEGRRHGVDAKLSDAFHESLEGLLVDLRTVTLDNHDAEAFLKPVSKGDVPDYYDVIPNPMDLQTMLRKVKTKQYKSKKEFKDDLDLIWGNCFTYNAAPEHPLRQCAKRLQVKSERLLKNITDRKERTDPIIPGDLPGRSPSAIVIKPNGINGHTRSHSSTPTPTPLAKSVIRIPPIAVTRQRSSTETLFPDMPAFVRTADGMSAFKLLNDDMEIDESNVEDRLRLYTLEELEDHQAEVESEDENIIIGEKRKLNGITTDPRPRKRSRTSSSTSSTRHRLELWWDAVQSDQLLANGLPVIVHSSSNPPSSSVPSSQPKEPPLQSTTIKRKKRKKPAGTDPRTEKTLLGIMNNNIRTMHRLRHIHAKFSSIKESNEESGLALPGTASAFASIPEPVELSSNPLSGDPNDINLWADLGSSSEGRSGVDIGSELADKCLHWMGGKVLEHVGFQGSSRIALDMLAGVASEYLFNVGRTIQFMRSKYAKKMSPEEIILHTLFESGITRIDDLERYIQDDVVKYGGRLTDLEKKLDNAYREATTEEAIDDDALFGNEDEEDNAFVMGDFTEAFGEDFLGLRELGIASELGLSNLSVPKKLMRPKRQDARSALPNKPKEPPPPFPLPPDFIPISSSRMEEQVIGLLRPYYKNRFDALAASATPKLPGTGEASSPMLLPDDLPNPGKVKMSPLGHIAGGQTTAGGVGSGKKKVKKDKETPVAPAPPPMTPGLEGVVVLKKRGGPGRGKKGKMPDLPPRVIIASA